LVVAGEEAVWVEIQRAEALFRVRVDVVKERIEVCDVRRKVSDGKPQDRDLVPYAA
jgi:hypothetical protein